MDNTEVLEQLQEQSKLIASNINYLNEDIRYAREHLSDLWKQLSRVQESQQRASKVIDSSQLTDVALTALVNALSDESLFDVIDELYGDFESLEERFREIRRRALDTECLG